MSHTHELELELSDALMQLASLLSFMDIESAVERMAKSGFKVMQPEFAKATLQIKRGATVQEALRGIAGRNHSRLLSDAMRIMVLGYETGAPLQNLLRKFAEAAYSMQGILKDRQVALTTQTFTLMAGTLIIPAILAMLSSLTDVMAAGSPTMLLSDQLYIIIYSAISAVFISASCTRWERLLYYMVPMMLFGLAVFHLILYLKPI